MSLDLLSTLLFVPGNQPARFEKALGSGAEGVILDLEDAVAPADKVRAREAIGAAWAAFSADERARLVVRINPHGTPWHDAECDWLTGLEGLQQLGLGGHQICTISKSSLRAPHSGQTQFMGTCSQGVPGAMPSSGEPAASS